MIEGIFIFMKLILDNWTATSQWAEPLKEAFEKKYTSEKQILKALVKDDGLLFVRCKSWVISIRVASIDFQNKKVFCQYITM